jgi:hypothetical protein
MTHFELKRHQQCLPLPLSTTVDGTEVELSPQYQFIGAQVIVAMESVAASEIAANVISFMIALICVFSFVKKIPPWILAVGV